MNKILVVALYLLSMVFSFATTSKISKPYSATVCEFFDNPLGLNLQDLSFSWKLDQNYTQKQSAYQIVVAATPDSLVTEPLWDTGKVLSNESINVPYQGRAIDSGERLYWKVRYWDIDDNASDWSDIKFFESGLLDNRNWQSKWISGDVQANTPIYLRKLIDLKSSPKSARLYVACKGAFEFFVNGKDIAKDNLNITLSNYINSYEHYTFDITKFLTKDENVLMALLGNGFYDKNPSILIQLELFYDDGRKDIFVSDDSWRFSTGALITSKVGVGELYDARIDMSDWSEPDFDDSAWQKVNSIDIDNSVIIRPAKTTPIVKKYEMTPISVNKISEGSFIFDFGQKITGKIALNIPSNYGKPINIEYAKSLNDNTSLKIEDNSVFDTYISTSYSTANIWKPSFVINNFRYVKLSGFSRLSKPTSEWLKAIVFYNDIDDTGSFFCSDTNLNILQNNIRWYFKNNLIASPLLDYSNADLPVYSQLYVDSCVFNMNAYSVYSKWNNDLYDYILSNSSISFISNSIIVSPWKLYQQYGNKKILTDNYKAMQAWVLRLQNYVSKSESSTDIIASAYLFRCTDTLANIASILDKKDDFSKYTKLAQQTRLKFISDYISKEGVVKGEDLSSYLLTLSFNIIQDNLQDVVFNNFLKKFLADTTQINIGAIESSFLLDILTKYGRIDIAYSLLGIDNVLEDKKVYPSIFQSNEKLDKADDIFALNGDLLQTPFYPAIGNWLYKNIAGIKLDTKNIAYKNIIFVPKPPVGMSFASATRQTPYGLAVSYWKISDGVMEWTVIIPPNSTGTIVFPTDNIRSIRINGNALPNSIFEDNKTPILNNVSSGTYQILLRPKGYL